MSKNPTIQEGGKARNFINVAKLETDLVGGGTQYWVPEEEAIDYIEKDKLKATEMKTYYPDDFGLQAFDEVEVDLSDSLGEKTITEAGEYLAEDDELIGYNKIIVPEDVGAENLITLEVTKNGEYAPEKGDKTEEGKPVLGYSEVIVKVEGVGLAKPLLVEENGTYDISNEPAEYDPVTGEEIIYVGYNPINVDVSEDEKDQIYIEENGTYKAPEGTMYNVVYVNVKKPAVEDEDGNDYVLDFEVDPETGKVVLDEYNEPIVTKTKAPKRIQILTRPRTTYEVGETISLSGISVKAFYGDGSVYDTENTPIGVVDASQLSRTPFTAKKSGQVAVIWRDPLTGVALRDYFPITVGLDIGPAKLPIPKGKSGTHGNPNVTWTYTVTGDSYFTYAKQGARVWHLAASSSPGNICTGVSTRNETAKGNLSSVFTYNGKTVYYWASLAAAWPRADYLSGSPAVNDFADITLTQEQARNICWLMVYGSATDDDDFSHGGGTF